MTIFIAICDDEKGIGAELENFLMEILVKFNVKFEIDVYFTGEELCNKMENGAHYNLVFLDIEFTKNAINGVEAGRFIREVHHNNMVSIVYISWEMKHAMKLFDIRPLHFLIKPLNYGKIEQVVKTYLEISRTSLGDFTYKIGHDIFKVQIKDIVYLESAKRKLILHLADGRQEEFYGTLKDIYQEQLQMFDFLFIHASYAVNYDYITSIKYNELFLINDVKSLPISQHKKKEVREAYYAIMERRMV